MTSAFNPNGRWVSVEIQWKEYDETEEQEIYIMNDPEVYDLLCADDDFDQRVWYYFKDEEEYKSYFSKDNGDDWFIIRELTEEED